MTKVLVTGGSGFVGKNLQKVRPDWKYVSTINCDLTKDSAVSFLFEKEKPDVVVHLAAKVGGILANRNNPASFFRDNLVMGVNIVDAAYHYNSKLVMLGTVCSYPKYTSVPFKEMDIWNGYPEETNAPYGIAKKALLTMCQAYHDSHGFKYTYLIPSNLYGPHDNYHVENSHVVPAIIHKVKEAIEENWNYIEMWGTGSATRDFLYVDDCVDGIIKAVESDYVGYMNLGTGVETSIHDLTAKICNMMFYNGHIHWNTTKPDGQPRRCVSYAKAAKVLNWRPQTPLSIGLQRTIDDIYPNFFAQ